MDTVGELVKKLRFYDKLNDTEQAAILKGSIIKKYSKNQILHDQSSECLGMILVLSGTVSVTMLSENGREINLYKIGAGDVDVLAASCVIHELTFETSIVAQQDCEVLVIPASIISKIEKENIYLHSYILEVVADKFSEVMWTMQQILFKRIDQRIAIFLLDEYTNNHKSLTIKITQEELAKDINSSREVIARILKRMSEEGLIELSRGKIFIKNFDNIKKLAITD
ncbi:Crp/Fnr family transcriptional regulator [Lachnobacterium bovis]|uniref:CRP/FNR family transcriptional regulator, anaerobic regulatory protein n=1 Tax=Lachnobacterium bovis DSM 14045 TaxID=1122142 RepID=A0A1H3JCP9_9FIRM|nr:Crp/Fnr family transcriptional regulator [Lachnobacterium bovis]SDY37617.1 CRP/FNR family transcriptional regulator, anaerobic regulatory protein [Lachnobacterium bovis DSM 14045]